MKIDVDTMIVGIVEGMLPEGQGLALHVALDVRRWSRPTAQDDDGKVVSRVIHFIIAKPTNYIRVYCAVRDDWDDPKPEEYKLQSEHDSCWRTDGFRMLHKTWCALDLELDEKGAPRDGRTDSCHFRLSSGKPTFIKVEEKRALVHVSHAEDRCSITSISKA